MARIATGDGALEGEALRTIRRIEDSLRRHGLDPSVATAQRDDAQSREERIQALLDRAAEILPADEMERLRREIEDAGA